MGPPELGRPFGPEGPGEPTTPDEATGADPVDPKRSTSRGGKPRAVRVEHASILRGQLLPGEVCDLNGEHPLTLDAVRSLLPGNHLAVIVTGPNGDIDAVARLGRRATRVGAWEWLCGGPPPTGPLVPGTGLDIIIQVDATELPVNGGRSGGSFLALVAESMRPVGDLTTRARGFNTYQATALRWSQPLCQVAGCNHTAVVETDHRIEWAIEPVSDLPNADRLCVQHHRMKTHHGYRLEPGTGRRRLIPP